METPDAVVVTSRSSMELQNVDSPRISLQPSEAHISIRSEHHGVRRGFDLEPADGGLPAWRVLFAAFVFEALLWGFLLSYGVFQNYYSQLPEFSDSPYIPIVGTVASGTCYLGAPLVTPLIRRYPKYQRHMIWLGWPISILGLVAGSFARTLTGLIATQGLMYGIGSLIFYYPIISMLNEWWIVRRGMAYGILFSATGISGATMPFILEAALDKYGYPTTLRGMAVALLVLTGPIVPLLKGRLPPPEQGIMARTDWSFLKKRLFYTYCISNIAQAMGHFYPSLYLPSYATSIGLSMAQGALLLALMSFAQVVGQFTFGYLVDKKLPLDFLILLSTIASALASFILWGLATSFPLLVVFSLFYGFFDAGYVVTWARMCTAFGDEPTAALAMYSILSFGRGVGNVLAGPISAILLSRVTDMQDYGVMRYKGIIIVTGACMLVSAFAISTRYVRFGTVRSS